jgi:hypothetical protein
MRNNPPPPTEPHITVVVEGVADAAVRAAIRHAIETVLHTAQVRGKWLIAVAPSETRGRWDLAVKTPAGRHVTSFAAARLADVPALAAQHVARHLAK